MTTKHKILWLLLFLMPLIAISMLLMRKSYHKHTTDHTQSTRSMTSDSHWGEEDDDDISLESAEQEEYDQNPSAQFSQEEEGQAQEERETEAEHDNNQAQAPEAKPFSHQTMQDITEETEQPTDTSVVTANTFASGQIKKDFPQNKTSQKRSAHVEKKSRGKHTKPAQEPQDRSKAPEQNRAHTQQEKKGAPTTKTLKLYDNFTKKTLGYKHWTGWYYPTSWILRLNGVVVMTFDGNEFDRVRRSITINPDKPVTAYYTYEFLHGKRHGWKKVTFKVDKQATSLKIGFDWKDPNDWQIMLSPAKPLTQDSYKNK